MRLSKHTLFIPDFPDEGKFLAFNTRTQAVVVIDRELKGIIDGLPSAPTEGRSREALSKLEEMGILVGDAVDENRVIEGWFRDIKSDTSQVKATVLTTYACNFACTYCVEEGVKARIYMDDETARRTVSYIRERVEEHSPKGLFVTFYGGEPLLNLRAIKIVAGGLREFVQGRGLPFAFGITTNGALLTPKVVDELKGYGLGGIKVTLDGTREFHDRKRPFKNGRGTFDIIMRNILYAVDRIDVDIGGNFDDENAGSFLELLDYLLGLGLAPKLHKVRFKPISAIPRDREGLPLSADLGCVYSESGAIHRMVELRRAILERGFRTDGGMGVNLCSVVMNNAIFIVDPRGKLYKCPAFVGREEFEVGDIRGREERGFAGADLWRRCIDCPYVPLCGDGCLYAAYVRYGDATRLNCQRDYMEFVVRENLKMNYELSRRKKV
ncbi:MAG: radical SAM protein [bacterium]